jgi:tRNA-binding protein
MENKLTWQEFEKIDIRVGTVVNAEIFKEVKKSAYKLTIDFGELGVRKSSAQITKLYQPEELIGKQVLAVVNFPAKQIATFMSECLVLGTLGKEKEIVLIQPERLVENGLRIG